MGYMDRFNIKGYRFYNPDSCKFLFGCNNIIDEMTILRQANLDTPLNIFVERVYESCCDPNTNNEETEEQETTFLNVLSNLVQLELSNSKNEGKTQLVEAKTRLTPYDKLTSKHHSISLQLL